MVRLRVLGAIVGLLSFSAFSLEYAIAQETRATFLVPFGLAESDKINKDTFAEAVKKTNGKDVVTTDIAPLNLSVSTGTFSEEAIEELTSQGFRLATPFTLELFNAGRCAKKPRLLKRDPNTNLPNIPSNVCRVVGAQQPGASTRSVWILDSGVDQPASAAGLLNVVGKVDCSGVSSCIEINPNVVDQLGHGTMVAGIIGGQSVPDASMKHMGLAGVYPGVSLAIVKVFDDDAVIDFWDQGLRALTYVLEEAKPGDVVNISWGARWAESVSNNESYEALEVIDRLLHAMADRQIRVVIAAGNARKMNDANKWPWVHEFIPANSAPYISPVNTNSSFPAGGIYSVSASNSTYSSSNNLWEDELWNGSASGASHAEPGVMITSLWVSNETGQLQDNTCRGTSFAAPVLAGLFARSTAQLSENATTNGPYPIGDRVAYLSPGTPSFHPRFPKCN